MRLQNNGSQANGKDGYKSEAMQMHDSIGQWHMVAREKQNKGN